MEVKRVCNLCEAMCGLIIETSEAGRIEKIKANPEDVFSKGAYCPKSQGLKDLYEDSDRIRKPLKKIDGEFVEISWKQAFDEIAEKTKSLQEKYGRSSVASYVGNPNVHNASAMMMLSFFFKALGTRNKFSATSVDQLPHMLVSYLMFGHQLLFPIPDIDHSEFMLIFGANPVVSNGSLMSAAGFSSRLKALQKRGGSFFVFDPRYTETASLADRHFFVRPGKDVYVLGAFLNLLLKRRPTKSFRLETHWKSLNKLKSLMDEFPMDKVEIESGISLADLELCVEKFVGAKKAVIYGRMGVSTQAFGSLSQWFIYLINTLSGALDSPGGALFTKPAIDVVDLMAKSRNRGSFARRHSRVRKLPEFSGDFPVSTLVDEIITPGEGQVRGLFTIAGNPVLSVPNGKALEEAIAGLELYVAIDPYLNATTRLADYILPPVSSLEHSHYDLLFNALAVRNTARYSPAIIKPEKDELDDGQILLELWWRLQKKPSLKHKVLAVTIRKMGFDFLLDLGLRFGPYKGLSLSKLRKNPSGIDLGALKPSIPERLFTKDKKIELVPEVLAKEYSNFLAQPKEELPEGALELIGRRQLRTNNSWMHNARSVLKNTGKTSCNLMMHPDDARKRGLEDRQLVRLRGKRGSIEIELSYSDKLMPGVVSVPHGWGHARKGVQLSWASKDPGVSVNDILTNDQLDSLSGNAILNGQYVWVEKLS